MAPLRQFLRGLGYDACGWGLGVNRTEPLESVARVGPALLEWADSAGRPVHLVGWSLGGVVARELARMHPEAVGSVVTFGSPIIGGPIHTAAARHFDETARARILADIERANRIRIRAPLTVIYSRRDGIVSWRACLDRLEPRAHHVEVRSTHFGMGLDPDVWCAVALALGAASTSAARPRAEARSPS
jgi:pimeloyl-ACP methyl ester carboxylesterase